MTERETVRRTFLDENGANVARIVPLPADASTRSYFRVPVTNFGPCLLMDDPPETSALDRYVEIASHLNALGLSAPRIHTHDLTRGLALIEDFGDSTFTRLLDEGADETALYELAIDTLVHLHEQPDAARRVSVPAYDMAPLIQEADLLADWFAPLYVSGSDLHEFTAAFDGLWRTALRDVSQRRETLVLRDFHVDNLMRLDGRQGPAACGLLDFQDGLIGACAYDVMSLTQDARRDLSPGLELRLLDRYLSRRPGIDRAWFMADYALLAAQRHAKVAGIFQRLSRRDGKHRYLAHVPRVLRLLDCALTEAGLTDIRHLMDEALPGWVDWRPPEAKTKDAPNV